METNQSNGRPYSYEDINKRASQSHRPDRILDRSKTIMALSPVSTFSNCFDQVFDACLAVQRGDANRAIRIVQTLQNDSRTLQRESQRCYDVLQNYSENKQHEMERKTAEINDLYQQEQDLEKQKKELKSQKRVLESRHDSEVQSLNDAQASYNRAERKRKDAEEEVDKLRTLWWVPIYGQILAIRELVEDYSGQARKAKRDMDFYRERCNEAEKEIANTDHQIRLKEMWISAREHNISTLKKERANIHQQLSDAKETSVFLLEAVQFWDDLSSISNLASLKTDRLEKVLSFAAKKNQVKILRSNGTKTIVGSFKDCWMEIEDMIRTNDLVYAVEDFSLSY